jgi:hypothetical protein
MQKLCEKLWFHKWENPEWKQWITYKYSILWNKNQIY